MIHRAEPSQLFLDSIHTAYHLAQHPGSFDEALALIDAWINARTETAQNDALNEATYQAETPF